MLQFLKLKSSYLRFAIIGTLICIGYYILESVNERNQMADFRVYYDACNAFLQNDKLYGEAFGVGSGFYKYSPFATIPFIPLAVLPYQIASIIFYCLITLCIIGWSLKLIQLLQAKQLIDLTKNNLTGWILFTTTVFMADHIERELHLGNVNLFLLILAAIVFQTKSDRPILAGVVYGVILLFKPHFLILFPYFFWKKEWKLIGGTGAMILAGLLIPAAFKGWDQNQTLHMNWLTAIQDHNVELFESPNTLYGIVNKFIFNGGGGSWLVLVGLALVGCLFLLFMLRNKKLQVKNAGFIEFFVLIALIPNLAHTDTEHFMWTWPLIAYTIASLFTSNLSWKFGLIVAMVCAFVPYCLNSPDIVGKEIRFLFDEGGLLGLANLIIIAVAVWIFIEKSRSEKIQVSTQQR